MDALSSTAQYAPPEITEVGTVRGLTLGETLQGNADWKLNNLHPSQVAPHTGLYS
ncbi:lasso RiPP family leader peptide-containing protein [Georgenia subflava]|uniref:Lasso RiPP family leader peptide-containing protein n=1 Tax=Georgenia subflava TaxID=1622177 RepID=A0A6N7ELA3_9MICO|nr:lasso RiPP family leader peptide-containing protein [Georgenia subflava]MPV39172.1 lasso RiPP family leader peptide-containing protein [Georgenia subflava]